MIDLKLVLENTEEIKKALAKKLFDGSELDKALKLDEERRKLLSDLENLKAEQNKISKDIPSASADEKAKLLEKSGALKEEMKNMEPKLAEKDEALRLLSLQIPNPPLDAVPEGKDDTENVVIETVGEKPTFDFTPLDHVELGKKLDILDIETAANMSGTRFYYLKNEAVQLEFALVQFVVNKLIGKGFTPIIPPVLVKEKAMEATGFFPAEKNQFYHVNPDDDDLYLVGTSEVPLCMLHADQILEGEKLPLRYAGISSCFRREAGTYGKDTQGIIRVHQFNKVEMFSFCDPSKSQEEHQMILDIEKEIMSDLGFYYQVVSICGGDLGAPAAQKYDIEVWIPTQEKFRELTSCSNCTDFQARRAKIRHKTADGKKELLHTLNGTAVAISRTLVAILENYQQKDGSVLIPDVLQGYMGGKTVIEPK